MPSLRVGLRRSSEPTIESPQLVKYWGDPTLTEIGRKAEAGDWRSVESFLRGLPTPEQRDIALEGLAYEIEGRPDWLNQWLDQRPGDYLALLFRGEHGICWAWQGRGHARANQTSREAFALFFERLHIARADLEAAAEIAPPDEAGAWVFQLTLARGLQYPKGRLLDLYAEANRRNPWHPLAVSSMVQGLAPKWSGSLTDMFAVARDAANARPGSPAHAAIVEAHFEAFLEVKGDYWENQWVHEEIMAAADRSIYSPAYERTPLDVSVRNHFLYAFSVLGEQAAWRRELEAVGGRLTSPFSYFSDPQGRYQRMRKDMAKAPPRVADDIRL